MRITIAQLQAEVNRQKELVRALNYQLLELNSKIQSQETIINHFKSNMGTQSCMIIGMERLGDAMAHVISDLTRGQR